MTSRHHVRLLAVTFVRTCLTKLFSFPPPLSSSLVDPPAFLLCLKTIVAWRREAGDRSSSRLDVFGFCGNDLLATTDWWQGE